MTRLSLRSLAGLLGALSLALGAAQVRAQDCKLPRTPENSRVEMVAPEMLSNGVAMSVRSIESALSVEGMLAFYRQLWAPLATDKRPGSREDEAEGWKVISTIVDRCFISVQVKPRAGGSQALLAVSRVADGKLKDKAAALQLPMLPGSRVLTDTAYAEPVRNARTQVIVNSARVSTNAEFYANELVGRGWTLLMRRQVPMGGAMSETITLRRGLEELSVVVAPAADGRTTVVANLVDRP